MPKQDPPSLEAGALSGPMSSAFKRSLPPWSAQAFMVLILLVLAAWALLGLVRTIHFLIWWGVIAMFLYFAMAPAVDWLVRKGLKRGLATGVVMLALLFSILVLLVSMSPLLVSETEQLISDIPSLTASLQDVLNRLGVNVTIPSDSKGIQNALSGLRGHLPDVAGGALSVTGALVGGFFEFFVVLLFTFFLLANQDKFRRFILSLMKPGTQTVFGQAWDIAVYKTGGYLYSRILTSILAGTVVGVALYFLDCPYPLALAIWYGLISQFLPMIGTYVAASLPLLILLTRNPWHALIFIIVLAAWIPFQDYIISPRVSAQTMSLAPASALIALLVGGAWFGPIGAFLALPAAAVIQSILSAFFPRYDVVESAATRGG